MPTENQTDEPTADPAVGGDVLPREPDAGPAARHEGALRTAALDGEVAGILRSAVEHSMPVEAIERLTALGLQLADRRAAVEFGGAMAEFQRRCEPPVRGGDGEILTKSGSKIRFRWARLDDVQRAVQPVLHDLGLSYSWDQEVESDRVSVTCVLRHVAGHERQASMACALDSRTGMSPAHQASSALTTCRRQTLVSVLGLIAADPREDEVPQASETITEDQARDLLAAIEGSGASLPRFLGHFEIERVSDLPASEYVAAVTALEARMREGGS